MKIEIKKMGINGEGIGYINKKPVFVIGAFTNEIVDVEITEDKNTYLIGEVKKVIKKSDKRISKKCSVEKCGSCSLMGLHPKEQVEEKRKVVCQALFKYANIRMDKIGRIKYNEQLWNYRNQIKMPLHEVDGVLKCGLYLPNSNIFTPVSDCLVHEVEVEQVRKQIEALFEKHHSKGYDRKTKKGLRTLVLRHLDGKYQCTLVSGNEKIDEALIDDIMKIEGMVNVGQSINTVPTGEVFGSPVKVLKGEEFLSFTFDGLNLQISNQSFFQLNTKQAINLYKGVFDMLKGEHYHTIVEAYSGIGGISLKLADLADNIMGIENIPSAVDNANKNALLNGKDNVRFILGDASEEIVKLTKEHTIDVVVVDPPRTGLSDEFINCLLENKPKKIVYVSCNLSTLGKNLAKLNEGYEVKRVVPYDMFSHTAHVENVVLLVRKEK